MSREQMQWHPAVHERLANERLVFWRLGFYPTYRRKEVLQALDIICERYGISGRTIYEVFGNYDLLLRFWLPEGVIAENVDRDIKRTLAAFHLELCASFEVEKIVRHWFWDEEDEEDEELGALPRDGGLSEALDFDFLPNEGVELPELDPTPTAWELAHVNELVDLFNAGQINQEAVSGDEVAQKFLTRKLIGLRDAEEGIKFTMVVSAYGLTASRFEAMEELERRLALILDNAKPIRERSLYSGGGFGRFMVFGKIPTEDFYEINQRLIEPITVQAGLAPVYRTRSETYIGSNPILQRFSETLSLPEYEAEDEIDIEEVLAEGETARNELKGSVFVNVNRWLKTGEKVDDGDAIKSFATALVALLNGAGGVIATGVLERSIRDYDSNPRLVDEPRVGELIVVGAEFEWEGWQRKGMDEFKNKLRQKLVELIEPNPLNYELQTHDYIVAGKTVFLLHVPEDLSTWFYLREGKDYKFIVRRDASSVPISGPEEDEYKRLHQRVP